ncbi:MULTISPECIES: chemotaxis protein CheW [Methylobacterium]|uniref:CheW-like domain-containing protein n=1 Tax=Methylobacterium jeotgali TaxID=381630 RepID=A0ABQ4SRG3_9HYPH|nr:MULTISPECIES: chemotaxis protein CheW [Methylobacterium]GBU18389.1 hypothetical protein AwMethylo_26040 [Methylobacterium sp.]GJE05804.1 hypothetical protein AOPFMNJM_1110 [Methylobacterium jeotgali]
MPGRTVPALGFLLLDVAGTTCALPREAASEILPLPRLSPAPVAGPVLAGFLDLGGVPVPVLDLAGLLGLREGAARPGLYAHLVLAADRGSALLVDRVGDLVGADPEALGAVPEERTLNGCVVAGLPHEGRLVPVLDPARILSAEERARVSALTRAAAARLESLPVA